MRITHVLGTDGFAGTERYVVEVAGEQARGGHDVAVVGGSATAMVEQLPPAVRWSPGAAPKEALRSLVVGGRRDVVHSHITRADFVALMAAPVTGGRRVSTRHITAPRGYGPLAQRLAPAVRAGLAREIAVSRYVSELITPRPDVVLLNGVRAQPDLDGERQPVVLMAHRLAPEKDTETGLRAWAASELGDRGWRLVIAGDGEDRSQLEALARELGVGGSVDFVGWLTDPAEAFRTASLFLAPASGEPLGLSVLEAMALGLPVVASASGGFLETVGADPGAAVFPPGDAAAAGALLRRLADDHAGRSAYGDRLRALQGTRFTLEQHVDALLGIYAEALAEGRRLGAPRLRRRS